MFDIGAAELLVIVIVAILVIGPKDMPLALRTAGRWIGKVRRLSAHFRTGVDAMIREAELEDMEKKWKAQNEAIMARSSGSDEPAQMTGPPLEDDPVPGTAQLPPARAESAIPPVPTGPSPTDTDQASDAEPSLPFGSDEPAPNGTSSKRGKDD